MPGSPRRIGVVGFAVIAIGAGVFLASTSWPQPDRAVELAGLILAALLTSALATEHITAKHWVIMPPSFVVNLTALLLLGPQAMMLVATLGAIMQGLTGPVLPHRVRRV